MLPELWVCNLHTLLKGSTTTSTVYLRITIVRRFSLTQQSTKPVQRLPIHDMLHYVVGMVCALQSVSIQRGGQRCCSAFRTSCQGG